MNEKIEHTCKNAIQLLKFVKMQVGKDDKARLESVEKAIGHIVDVYENVGN
jgi:hypothetical protein